MTAEGLLTQTPPAREELDRLRSLVAASSTLLSSPRLEDLLPRIIDLSRTTLAADAHSLWRLDPVSGHWALGLQHGLSKEYVAAASMAVTGGAATVSLEEPVVIEDVDAAEWLPDDLRAAHRAEGTRSMLVVGLRDRQRVIGTLAFYYRERHAFTEGELSAASTLANLASAAIVTAELYEAQARVAEDRRLVAEASELLASSLDYETTLRNVAALVVPRFADWCTIDMVSAAGTLERLTVAHVDAEKVRLAEELADRYPPDADVPHGPGRVIRTGEPEVIAEVSDDLIVAAARGDDELLAILRALGLRSSICVPLVARGRPLGAITFIAAESGIVYGDADLATAQDLARRAALAVDNALLYREAEAARERAEESLAAAESARERLSVLAEASTQLASTLDYERTLANIASLLVPRYADWYAVDIADGASFRRIAVVHRDPAKAEWAARSRDVYGAAPDEPEGTGRVARTGEPVLYHRITDDLLRASTQNEDHYETLRQLGMESAMVVPLKAGGRTFGALMLVSADPNRLYDEDDLDFALHLGRRAAVAVDNARLYNAAQERARAALVVEHVADGVFLVDRLDVIRLWNPAAERITGVSARAAVGSLAADVFAAWDALAPLADETAAPETRPVEINGRELWLSVTGVRFEGGAVFAFRDLTAEHAVERLKSDFVATVSHELRTPLAAIYGAALTLRRSDVQLPEPQRSGLLEVIASESDRLARIVNDILWASRLESGRMQTTIQHCDPVELARGVVDAAASYAPPNIRLAFEAGDAIPAVAADPDKVRQVLTNLVDNAVKYSPDGGTVGVSVAPADGIVRIAVADQGLGVPPAEHRRVFEKFYRLDPNLTRGVGGTGLGLYISRELVERMGGRIWVESDGSTGSTFVIELPVAE